MVNTLDPYIVLDAASTTGAGNKIFVKGAKYVTLSFDTDGGGDAALTAKIQGSLQEVAPDFNAAQSVSNSWTYLQGKDLDDGGTENGTTGAFIVATADAHKTIEINVNRMTWITVNITAITEGELTVKASVSFED